MAIPVREVTLPGEEDDPLKGKGYADPLQPDNGDQYKPLGSTTPTPSPAGVSGGDIAPGGGFASPINPGIITGNMGSDAAGWSQTPSIGATESSPSNAGQPGNSLPAPPGTPPAPRTANTYAPTLQTVQPNQTVSGQVTDLLKADNPLMQTARSDAAEAANSRGLLNSTMAVQAGEQAAINSALPIASQDAQTFNRVGSENAAAQNTSGQFNAGSQNQFNLSAQQAGQEQVLQQMKGDQAKAVADIEAQYKTILQSNASASQQFTSVMDNIGRILNDPNTTAAQKQAGVDKQIQLLKSAMTIIGSISNIDLTSLLDFSSISRMPPPGTPGAPPAGVPGRPGTAGDGTPNY